MNNFQFRILLSVFLFFSLNTGLFCQMPLHPDRGLALIWYGSQENLSSRDGLVNIGQIMFMWRDFESKQGKYEFAALDEELKKVSEKGLKTTIQINANYHPEYLFNMIPYLDGIALPGQKNHTVGYGPLMYWSEAYKERYSKLVHALANHLRASPYKENILAIRQSYCAVGTEHHHIPPEYRDSSNWTFKNKVKWGENSDWTDEVGRQYKTWALDLFVKEIKSYAGLNLFVRADAVSSGIALDKHIKMIENGELWLFHTSTEPQPRNESFDRQYEVFEKYCKTGKTYGFMESWSKASTGAEKWLWTKTSHPITKPQFNYWTLLCDLHCGATFPAMRPEDMDVPEYREDYEFASKYAGYLHSPETSPGAWIAFREGDFLKGDYTFLMERNTSDNSIPLYNTDDEKYGLWSSKVGEKGSFRIKIDQDFMMSLEHTPHVKVKVWYKDDNEGSLRVHAFGKMITIDKKNTGIWKTVEIPFKITVLMPIIDIVSLKNELTVHKVELFRIND